MINLLHSSSHVGENNAHGVGK